MTFHLEYNPESELGQQMSLALVQEHHLLSTWGGGSSKRTCPGLPEPISGFRPVISHQFREANVGFSGGRGRAK